MASTRYYVIKLEDGSFGVKVIQPDGRKSIVCGFKDEPAAAAWVALQKYPRKDQPAN
jgi:hypothetical protein